MVNLFGESWITTAIGIIIAVLNAIAPLIQQGGEITLSTLIQSAGYAALGFVAKDWNVTGTKKD